MFKLGYILNIVTCC